MLENATEFLNMIGARDLLRTLFLKSGFAFRLESRKDCLLSSRGLWLQNYEPGLNSAIVATVCQGYHA